MSVEARLAASAIRSMFRRDGPESSGRRSSIWARPLITVSRLLKSCATPPASRPIASIFWDCRRWSSSRFRSVTSTNVARSAVPCRHDVTDIRVSTQISVPSRRTP